MILHIRPTYLSGGYIGVDVFFVISGYLITSLLVREIERSGSISLSKFYYRRIRRLVPCATFVLVITAVCSVFLLPATQWRNTAHGIFASALYVENWDLIHKSANYLNAFFPPTPVQHYWSLSVEGQFYFFWPLAIMLGDRLLFKGRYDSNAPVTVFFGATLILFALALFGSYEASVPAYFSTVTRIWELALGGAIVFFGRVVAFVNPRGLNAVGWLGIISILIASIFFSNHTLFPGYAALLPTLGAALVICSGLKDSRLCVSRILAHQPLRYVGDISYSMYLWHWPALVFYKEIWGENVGLLNGIFIFCFTIALSHGTWKLVELPFYKSQEGSRLFTPNTVALAASCTALSVAFAFGLFGYLVLLQRAACCIIFDPVDYPGAHALEGGFRDSEVGRPVIPDPLNARYDRSDSEKDGCELTYSMVDVKGCGYGVEGSTFRIVLVGDSHAEQWLPALKIIAQRRQFDITVYAKAHCAFAAATQYLFEEGRVYSECDEWRRQLLQKLRKEPPDILITSAVNGYQVVGSTGLDEDSQRMATGFWSVWKDLGDDGTKVFAIRDTPYMPFDVPDCLARRGATVAKCSTTRSLALKPVDPLATAAARDNAATLVDMNDYICTSDTCEAVVGNILVYQDSNHLTATYARSLAPMLDANIKWSKAGSASELNGTAPAYLKTQR
jgi:peptidoglycan/LPS O-acetylase OafA/YrhL